MICSPIYDSIKNRVSCAYFLFITRFLFKKDLIELYVYISVKQFVHMTAGVCRGQEKVAGPLEVKLQEDRSCLMWVLGMKLWSSASAGQTFNCQAISPDSGFPLHYTENFGF